MLETTHHDQFWCIQTDIDARSLTLPNKKRDFYVSQKESYIMRIPPIIHGLFSARVPGLLFMIPIEQFYCMLLQLPAVYSQYTQISSILKSSINGFSHIM